MNHRVLIVDDEPNIANTLEAILRSAGYEAKATGSAEQALEVVADWQPALAIVDVILPLLNGIELSKLLRARFPECGLLLFSGETCTGELLEQAEKDGHKFEILAKPIPPGTLLAMTAAILTRGREPPLDQPGLPQSIPASITTPRCTSPATNPSRRA